jgi:hypothetical protein
MKTCEFLFIKKISSQLLTLTVKLPGSEENSQKSFNKENRRGDNKNTRSDVRAQDKFLSGSRISDPGSNPYFLRA